MKALVWNDDSLGAEWTEDEIPATWKDEALAHRHVLLEAASEFDDEVLECYLEGDEIDDAVLRDALRAGALSTQIVPVLCGSAFKNKGVQPLLDAVVDYLPAPTEVPEIHGIDPNKEKPLARHSDVEEPFCALAFKIMTDPFVGRLTYFRVYSGTMGVGSMVYNPRADKKERLGRVLLMHANKREEMQEVRAGDIVAAVGLRFVKTATRCAICTTPSCWRQ